MSYVANKFTTTASTNLTQIRSGQACKVMGLSGTGVAAAYYIHFYWVIGNVTPTVGTTVPQLTIQVPITNGLTIDWAGGITAPGALWVSVTGGPLDTDSTNATVSAVVSILVE